MARLTFQGEHAPGALHDYKTGNEECWCTVKLLGEPEDLDYLADEFQAYVKGTRGEGEEENDGTPMGVAEKAFYNLDPIVEPHPPSVPEAWWEILIHSPWPFQQDPFGEWNTILSRLNYNDTFTDCADYEDVTVKITQGYQSRFQAVSEAVSPSGAEDDLRCTPGETKKTRFQLANFPGVTHLVPVADSGHTRYAGTRVKKVTVTNWNNADTLRIAHWAGMKVLTPASPSADIGADDWWFGANRWWAAREADSEAWLNPVVELDLECPTSPVGGTISLNQGYGMSLTQLAGLVNQATGNAGIGALVASAQDPSIPLYALRIDPLPSPTPAGSTHLLRLELRGTWARVSLPLKQTGTDTWALVTDGPHLKLEGSLTRTAQDLTLSLTGGSLTDENDTTIPFQSAGLVLSALGDD